MCSNDEMDSTENSEGLLKTERGPVTTRGVDAHAQAFSDVTLNCIGGYWFWGGKKGRGQRTWLWRGAPAQHAEGLLLSIFSHVLRRYFLNDCVLQHDKVHAHISVQPWGACSDFHFYLISSVLSCFYNAHLDPLCCFWTPLICCHHRRNKVCLW